MKMKYGVILTVLLATGAMAQTSPPPLSGADTTTPIAPAPMQTDTAPVTNKPAKAKAKATPTKAAPKKAAARKPAKPVVPEAPGSPFLTNDLAVSKQNNVRVRAKANINSEIVMILKEGQAVTALGETNLAHPKTDEPGRWVKIALPEGSHVWVSSLYLEGGQTVKPKVLQIRSGPSENYPVIGDLHKGDAVKSVSTKGDWTEIEAPAGSFGFVAAHLLAHKEVPAPPIAVAVVPQVETPVASGTQNVVVPPVEPPPAAPIPVAPVPIATIVPTPTPEPVSDVPLPPRVVQREGVVGDTVSIQAPTYFQLNSMDTGKALDYLYSGSTNVPPMTRYRGMTVLVSGEESLDERWPSTPVLTIQRIQVVK